MITDLTSESVHKDIVVHVIVSAFNVTFNSVISTLGKSDYLLKSRVRIFVMAKTEVKIVFFEYWFVNRLKDDSHSGLYHLILKIRKPKWSLLRFAGLCSVDASNLIGFHSKVPLLSLSESSYNVRFVKSSAV